MVKTEDPALESTFGLEDPRQNNADGLVSDRDRIAAALFERPVPRTEVGRYSIDRKLGEGAMGVVYEGRDEALDRTVALKVIRTSAWDGGDATSRFQREAQALARLSHPNVVTIHEIGEHEDQLFIAMELVRGRTLREWVRDEKPDWRTSMPIFVQAGRGLAAAHAAELVHRDFKPANCIVGDDGRVRVLDFGLARGLASEDEATESRPSMKVLEATLTATGALVGTPAYMAPEQLRGRAVDAASDQFAFCVALYEALVGVRPFSGNSAYTLHENIRNGTPRGPTEAQVTGTPAAVLSIVSRGLSYESTDRWPDMASLLDALEQYPIQRRRRRTLAAGVVVAALTAGGVAFAQREAPCSGLSENRAPGWTEDRRSVVRASIMDGGDRSQAVWQTFDTTAGKWANAWTQARVHACEEALVLGRTTPGVYDRQAACLDRREATFSRYTEQLSTDPSAWRNALAFAEALPSIASCTDPDRVLAIEPPSPAIASRVDEVRARVDDAYAHRLSGDIAKSSAVAESAQAGISGIEYPQLSAQVNLLLGTLDRNTATESAETPFLAALRDAEVARDDHLAAEVATELLGLAIENRQPTAALRWQALASAKLQRVQASPLEFARLEIASTELALLQGDSAAAAQHSARTLDLLEQSVGLDDVRTIVGFSNRALALELAEDTEAVLAAHDKSVAAHQKTFGPHPATANALYVRGSFRADIGLTDGAEKDYEQALAILDGVPGEERLLANARMGLVWLRSMSGTLNLTEVDRATAPLQHLPVDDELRLIADEWRASVLQRIGEPQKALDEYDRLLRRRERREDQPAQDLAMLRSNAAECEYALGQFEEAQKRFATALAELRGAVDPGDPRLAYPLVGLGNVALATGRPTVALGHFERALEIVPGGWGDTLLIANLHWGLARSLATDSAQRERSRESGRKAAKLFGELGAEGKASLDAVEQWQSAAD